MDRDLTGEHLAHITKLVNTMHDTGKIDENCRACLVDFVPSTARFYMPPKIHKGLTPPPGRPIRSCNGCPTEKISEFVDFFLKPIVPKLKAYVKDTTDFVKLEGSIRKQTGFQSS